MRLKQKAFVAFWCVGMYSDAHFVIHLLQLQLQLRACVHVRDSMLGGDGQRAVLKHYLPFCFLFV